MMGLVRKGKHRVRGSGFIVTWDVDSRDRSAGYRPWAFLFGRTVKVDAKEYRDSGFVWKDGVRHLRQSVVFVLPHRLNELAGFLMSGGIEYDIAECILLSDPARRLSRTDIRGGLQYLL